MHEEYANAIFAPFMREALPLATELRSSALAASQHIESKATDDLARAQQIYDTGIDAIYSRLQTAQDRLTEQVDKSAEDEHVKNRLRNGLSDLRELATLKRDSILSQARIRELQPVDPSPLGVVRYVYKGDGNRILQPHDAPPEGTLTVAPGAYSQPGGGFPNQAPPSGPQGGYAYTQPGGQPQGGPGSYPAQGGYATGPAPGPNYGYPAQGYQPQGGYPPQGYPPQGYPPQGYPPQGY